MKGVRALVLGTVIAVLGLSTCMLVGLSVVSDKGSEGSASPEPAHSAPAPVLDDPCPELRAKGFWCPNGGDQ